MSTTTPRFEIAFRAVVDAFRRGDLGSMSADRCPVHFHVRRALGGRIDSDHWTHLFSTTAKESYGALWEAARRFDVSLSHAAEMVRYGYEDLYGLEDYSPREAKRAMKQVKATGYKATTLAKAERAYECEAYDRLGRLQRSDSRNFETHRRFEEGKAAYDYLSVLAKRDDINLGRVLSRRPTAHFMYD